MRPDPGRALMDQVIAATPPEVRVERAADLRHTGLLLAWQQSDAAGLADELERAYFLLDRLYPEMPPEHREQFRAQLKARYEAGTWQGFQRPEPVR